MALELPGCALRPARPTSGRHSVFGLKHTMTTPAIGLRGSTCHPVMPQEIELRQCLDVALMRLGTLALTRWWRDVGRMRPL